MNSEMTSVNTGHVTCVVLTRGACKYASGSMVKLRNSPAVRQSKIHTISSQRVYNSGLLGVESTARGSHSCVSVHAGRYLDE